MAIFSHFDLGGGTVRKGTFRTDRKGKVSMIDRPAVKELKFSSSRQLIGLAFEEAKKITDDQDTIIFPIAGPVDKDHKSIIKFPNQNGILQRNIPFAHELESRLSGSFRRKIRVVVINDGEAGAYAEFSPLGALAKLCDGDLGMAFIIGNGVGGRLYVKNGDSIVPVPGAFEPGHRLVPKNLVKQLGYFDLLRKPDENKLTIKCGCGIKSEISIDGDNVSGNDICYETLVKGPALQKLFNRFIGAAGVKALDDQPLRDRLRSFPPMLTYNELEKSPFFWHIFNSRTIDNKEVSRILNESKRIDPISDTIFAKEGTILGYVFQKLQDGFNEYSKPITFALTAGIGCNFGKYIIPHVRSYLANLRRFHQISSWAKTPMVTVGKLYSDETNLYGAMYYMLDLKKHS